MKAIEIDDEVFAYLQGEAIAYVETPNLTLRRILGIDKGGKPEVRPRPLAGRKKRKADLTELTRAGLILEGQRLALRNYQGRDLPGCEAVVSHGALLWNGQRYSMSGLAKVLFQKEGYQSKAVRGPEFWFTEDGVSIKDVWDRYLKSV